VRVKELLIKMDDKEMEFKDVEVAIEKSGRKTIVKIEEVEKGVDELARELNEELEKLLIKLSK